MQKRESLIVSLLTICLIFCFISVKSQVTPPGKKIQNVYFHGIWVGEYDDLHDAIFKFKQNGSKVELDRGHADGWKWYGQITNGVLKYYETQVVRNSGTYIYNYEFRLLNDGYTMECKYSGITGKYFKTMKLYYQNLTKSIQKDNDQDRVLNEFDVCPKTPKGLTINNGGVNIRGCQVLQNQQANTISTNNPFASSTSNSKQLPTDYQVQPNEKESTAIKLLSNILEEHVYSTDIATDDQKMRSKGYTVYKPGMSHSPRTMMPKLVTKSGKIYYNENTQKIEVPNKPGVKAELRYRDGSVLNLKPGAKLELVGHEQIYLSRNGVHVRVVKTGKEFLIRTQTAVCGIRGTEFDIGYYDGVTQIKLYEGSLSIFNEKHSIMLLPNEQAEIPSKTEPIKRSKIKIKRKSNSSNGKIPYTLPQAKWVKQNTIDGYYTTAISSYGKEEMVFITGSISSSQYAPNVHRIYYHQKSRASHNMGSDANGIFALDKEKLWICGKRGGIAFNEKTALEAFWKNQKSGTSLDLNAIYFNDEKNGWCVGNNGIVLNTKNGGNSWNVKSGFIRKPLVGVQFVDDNNGWILCNGTYYPSEMPLIYYTTDGGNSWRATEVAAGLKNSRMAVNAMWFIDENNGWIVGANNLIMFTKDGSVSWDYYQKAKQGGTNLHDIQFTDPWNGWICGEKGLLMHTIDGGKTWKKESINETETLTGLHFNGPYIGWLITNKKIYQYKDEKLFNQYRAKFIKGEWDTWSNVSKTKKDDNIVPKRKQNPIDVNNKPSVPKKKATPTAKKKTITKPKNNTPTAKKKTIPKPKNNKLKSNNNSFAEFWSLNTYNTNIESFKQNVTTKTNKGFVPVGLNCTNEQYEVLYLGGGVLSITAWNMEWYNDANSLQEGINKNMNQGYIPSGFSWNGKAYYVFYIKSNFNGKAWQIVPSALDLNAVSTAIKPFVDQKYTPMGITIFGDEYYTLLVQFDTPLAKNWFIEGYNDKRSEIVKNINKKLPDGSVPWGILKSSGVANILYIGM